MSDEDEKLHKTSIDSKRRRLVVSSTPSPPRSPSSFLETTSARDVLSSFLDLCSMLDLRQCSSVLYHRFTEPLASKYLCTDVNALSASEMRYVRRLRHDMYYLGDPRPGFPDQLKELEVGNFAAPMSWELLPKRLVRLVVFQVGWLMGDPDVMILPTVLPQT